MVGCRLRVGGRGRGRGNGKGEGFGGWVGWLWVVLLMHGEGV